MLQFLKNFLVLAVFVLTSLIHTQSYALDSDVIVVEEDLTLPAIKASLNDADMATRIDDEGYILIQEGAVRLMLRINQNTKCIVILGHRYFRDSVDVMQKYHLMNKINNEFVIARASISKDEDRIFVDYTLPFNRGITLNQINNAVLRMLQILSSFDEKDGEDILK